MHLCIFAPMHIFTLMHFCILAFAILHFCILVMYQNQVKGKSVSGTSSYTKRAIHHHIRKERYIVRSGTSSYTKHHIRKERYIVRSGTSYHHIRKSRERIKGYSWLCVIFKNLGIDCYSNIFIAILNETLIRFFGLVNGMPGGNEKIRSTGVTLCYNFENVALSVSVLTQKKN